MESHTSFSLSWFCDSQRRHSWLFSKWSGLTEIKQAEKKKENAQRLLREALDQYYENKAKQ